MSGGATGPLRSETGYATDARDRARSARAGRLEVGRWRSPVGEGGDVLAEPGDRCWKFGAPQAESVSGVAEDKRLDGQRRAGDLEQFRGGGVGDLVRV